MRYIHILAKTWPSIDIVAQCDDHIVVVQLHVVQQRIQCGIASVDVTNSKMSGHELFWVSSQGRGVDQ